MPIKTSRKIKRAAAVVVLANDPTPERMRRDGFETIPAPRMPDERIGRDALANTRKQASRVRRMEREGWVTRTEAAALERYELMIEQAGYASGRSCMDMSPRGGGGPEGIIDRLAGARSALAGARNAIAGDEAGQVALVFVDAVLSPYGGETIDDVAERLIGGHRGDRLAKARMLVGYVAAGLVVYFGGGR